MSLLLVCVFVGLLCFGLDLRSKEGLYLEKNFWVFQGITAVFTIIFDAFARNRVWVIGPEGVLSIRVLGTPVELLIFGFVLLYANVLAYEWLLRRSAR